MIKINQFIRANAVRAGKVLTSAPIVEVDTVGLPLESAVHYVSGSNLNLGIRVSHPLVRSWDKEIRLHFLTEGSYPYGRTKHRPLNINKTIQDFFRRNKRFRRSRDLDRSLLADRDLLVMDYSLLPAKVTYTPTKTVYQDSWYNTAVTIMEQVDIIGRRRNQFIDIPMPQEWVTEAVLKTNAETISDSYRDRLRDPSILWIREIYAAILGHSTILDIKAAENLFFVFTEGRYAIYVSLSTLLLAGDESPTNAARQFHDMLEKLLSKRTVTDTAAVEAASDEPKAQGTPSEKDFPPTLLKQVKNLVDAGKLTNAEQQRLGRIAAGAKNIDSPTGEGTLGDFVEIPAADLVLSDEIKAPVNVDMVPADATKSSTANFKKDYIEKVMEKDIAAMIMSFNRAGLLLNDYKITESGDALEVTRTYSINFIPVQGRESTTHLELPVFEADGTFSLDGVRYTMDAQKVDLPIRKTKLDQAALTSYYGKLFVSRSPLVKSNYNKWLLRNISNAGINGADNRITELRYGAGVIPNIVLPRDYTALMVNVSGFHSGDYTFDFDYVKRKVTYGDAVNRETKGSVICGTYKDQPMLMDTHGMLSVKSNDGVTELGTLLEVTGDNWGSAPRDVAVFKSLGRNIPVSFLLGYYLGLDGLLKYTKAKFRYEPINQRSTATVNETVILFSDERLIVDVSDPVHSLLFSGLSQMDAMTKQYSASDYNKAAGWKASISHFRGNAGHFLEYDLMEELFLDPITIEVLETMREPTNLVDLMLRCVDLIKTDDAPDEADPKYMRIRGMERIAGTIYMLMVQAIREQRRQPNPGNAPISLPPGALKAALNADSSIQLVSEINPIHNLKEQEAVTLAGEGGRSARTLVKRNRLFHDNDVGILSEHTPDSSKVGIRSFLTPNAKINGLRGLAGDWEPSEGSTSLLSTSGLTFPDMDRDDGKRGNLAAVQQSAVVPAVGYEMSPYQTGYGSVIASRVSPFFVFRAKGDGVIKRIVKDSVMEVVYADGSKEGYKLGVKHGNVSGELIPHHYVTDLPVRHEFKEGDVLVWNKGFFTRDFFAPTNVSMLSGCQATVALMEGNDTLEDGSAISEDLGKRLTTRVAKRKGILVDFDQEVTNLVKEGDHVEFDSVICTIMESALAGLAQTDESLAALSKLSNTSPKAKFAGDITKVEIFYMGKLEDMSDSLRALAEADNVKRTKMQTALNSTKAGMTGAVNKSTFIAGEKLLPNTVIISVYIDHDLGTGIGDKIVVANQLKSVPGRVLEGVNKTAEGEDIDLIFGWRSINDRIVRSCIVQGTMNAVLTEISQSLAREYMEAGE